MSTWSQNTLNGALAIMMLAITWPGSSNAGLIYDNAASLIDARLESDRRTSNDLVHKAADDFVLSAGSIVNEVKWTGTYFYQAGGGPSADDVFTITLYNNTASGMPLSVVTSSRSALTIMGSVSRDECGVIDDMPLFCYSARVAATALSAGSVYWLSIVDGAYPTPNAYWGWAGQSGVGNAVQLAGSDPNVWTSTDKRLDFQLIGSAPEPSSLLLLLLGLAGLGAVTQRRLGC